MGIKIGEGTKIGENVRLGLGVSIGRYCDISDNCEWCIFSTVKDRVYLGKASFVGKDSDIESDSRVMSRAVIAPRNIVKKTRSLLKVLYSTKVGNIGNISVHLSTNRLYGRGCP